jgi:hypothetical protein
MPVGQTTMDGKVHYKDTSYNGVITNDFYKGGTGLLTDGKPYGRVKFTKEFKGKGWVGWSSLLTQSQYIDITFEFSGVRKFTNVTLFVNVDKKRGNAVFSKSQTFFSSTKDGFSNTSFLHCYPKDFGARNDPYNAHVTLSLCPTTAMFVQLRLYFGGKWLLIPEVSFNSGILLYYVNDSKIYVFIFVLFYAWFTLVVRIGDFYCLWSLVCKMLCLLEKNTIDRR